LTQVVAVAGPHAWNMLRLEDNYTCSRGLRKAHDCSCRAYTGIFLPPPWKNSQYELYVLVYAVRLFVVRLHIFRVTRCTYWSDFNETWYKYSSCEWTLLKRFSRSEVKVKVMPQPNAVMAEAYISTVWRPEAHLLFQAPRVYFLTYRSYIR